MPSATKTKTKNKVKGKATKNKAATKQPEWSVITYEQIEERREKLGYAKSAMAQHLGVTNSTYHNWRRGTSVPYVSQQEQIKATIASLSPKGSASSGFTKGTKAGASKAKGVKGNRASTKGARKAPGTAQRSPGDVGRRAHHMPDINASGHPIYPAPGATVPGIAAITAAYISSQKKPTSAGSVYEFVRGLRDVLNEG